jgi:broad specificity phosphatase PhoE
MAARVVEAIRAIAVAHTGGRVLVVTHGGPMRALWLAAGGEHSSWRRSSNCDVLEIAVEDGRVRRLDSAADGGLHQQVQG